MSHLIEWLDSLPVFLSLFISVVAVIFGFGVLLFAIVFLVGEKLGMISRTEMKELGFGNAFFRVILLVFLFPALFGAMALCFILPAIFYERVFGLSRENAGLAGLYTPILPLVPFWVRAWIWNRREEKERQQQKR